MALTQEERILRAKILLQKGKPFWSFLISYLKIREAKEGELACDSMGVKPDGELLYAPKFVDTLNDEELKGVLAHEVGHLVLDSMARRGGRDPEGWNVSTDIIINTILKNDGFTLPKGDLIPEQEDNDWSVELKYGPPIGTIKVENLLKKCAEDVYEVLPKMGSIDGEGGCGVGGGGTGKGKGKNPKGFDEHLGDKESPDNLKAEGKQWKKRAIEAATYARMQGNLSAEMEDLIGALSNNKVSWKNLLRRYITNNVPNDWTYARPNKRSQAVGVYMPRLKKENTKVVIAIDTSGSIAQKELEQFTSEIVSIAKTLPHVEMTVLQCDAKVQELMKVENGNIKKIKEMKVKGRGGTSFIPVFDKLLELQEDTKVLVYFTDGYGDFPDKNKYKWNTIWAVVKDGLPDKDFPFGKVVRLE